ncbi:MULTISPECIES: glutathione synthase [Yersinia]|uniref:glutathione synthase n=2 Tax=Yersinia TaxID=629 RepID=A0AAD2V002_YEREN|nr:MULTISPECIES: glutathione synthase [Yersinia]EKN6067039.1 glutathione synthase [Yersinia enterocolitica]ELI8102974.1 glutathione synthase [Yersinia enterocolitica]CNK89904.1 glutathione synthetase [Yersinia aleksiciae]CQQ50991.1 glutathione synthetase [Yersinia enterocolitica]CRX43965.1 glutathione synthetase [Yersinia enterocolitica]
MSSLGIQKAKDEAVEWALTHGVAFKESLYSAVHTPFTLAPTPISRRDYQHLKSAAQTLSKLIYAVSEDHGFLYDAVHPITAGDPFFSALLNMHQQIHSSATKAPRLPLLIMRSDFMDDKRDGHKLVEFNGIAAGMGPFGQRIHELHHYLQRQWPAAYMQESHQAMGELVSNYAIEGLSAGIAEATFKIKREFGDTGPARFLMIVQEHENNVFDQHLLELALQQRGIETQRRTFRELHYQLSTGANNRLLLDGIGSLDTVYLRAGYQYSDYEATDLKEQRCCQALMATRVLIERHRVAVNATVAQQLATSKRVQLLLSRLGDNGLLAFGLTPQEADTVRGVLGEMHPVTPDSIHFVKAAPSDSWVLKNQGEGGGHCLFGADILAKLETLEPQQYQAWSLMGRLHPVPRPMSAWIVRKGELHRVTNLISELGMFTVQIDGNPGCAEQSFAGYLLRSKSAESTEGGIHSGQGVLDSLVFSD